MFRASISVCLLVLWPAAIVDGHRAPEHVSANAFAVPGAPTALLATAGNGAASVRFLAPLSDGGDAITGYTVTASPGGLTAAGTASPIVVSGLTNGTIYTFTVTATNASGNSAASSASNPVTPAVRTVPALDPTITWVLPSYDTYGSVSDAVFAQTVADLRIRIGEGPKAKIGLSLFFGLNMNSWTVDTTDAAAVRAQLADPIDTLDAAIARAEANGIPLGISIITAIRYEVDGVQTAAQAEDRRNVQWYQDHGLATGWVTFSPYAKKLRRVQEAYVREFGRVLADRMASKPNVLVAVTGDGEVEMSFSRFLDFNVPVADRGVADYSPFAIAEFRDWLRGTGAYATGQPLAGQAYTRSARYAVTDGLTTLNSDFGTNFTSWDLRYFNNTWDAVESLGAILTFAFEVGSIPDGGATLFDAPRTIPFTATGGLAAGNAWWQAWMLFRQEMVHRYNKDFARWITQSTDSQLGGVPADRWYSAQVPADMLFGSPPPDTGLRLLTGASPHWTADIRPYGGVGVTGYNANGGGAGVNGPFYRTTVHVAPRVAAMGRWGIVEWNPGDPYSNEPDIYRLENEIVRRYRPSLLMPYKLNSPHWKVLDSGFETGLRELMHGNVSLGLPGIAVPGGWLPTIAWATPRRVLSGTALSATQLNASANIAGTITYSPAPGTVLATGTHTLSSTFTPSDPDWGRVTARVTIIVDPLPTMTLSPTTTRRFTGNRQADSSVTDVTPAQDVTVTFSNPGTTGWTTSADQPWVVITNGSGVGSGVLSIGVNPSLINVGVNSLTATVTVTAGNVAAGSSPKTIGVAVELTPPAQDLPPEGQVDTPVQNATGVQGSVGITGWAVDDRGVASVRIYRTCFNFDAAACGEVADHRRNLTYRIVFLGTAAFIAGARPDIEAVYPNLPFANRGGWGFLVLTSMLPNVPAAQPNGGQGTLSFFAIATDTSGKNTLLGRSANPVVAGYNDGTQITMDNLAIGKPFGAIDTPGQGEMVRGTIANFGWALTPDRNTNSGDTGALGDIDIRQPGASTVFIDSVPVGQITFDLCRGTVGNPVPLAAYCNDDVSSIFGHLTPQSTFAPRTSNPTLFRNLDAGRGAIGAFVFNTTTLTNGLHTIAWGVTDSAGRGEGIGSRFFVVLNAGADPAVAARGQPAGRASDEAALRAAPALVVGDTSSLDQLPRVIGALRARTGFDIRTALSPFVADDQAIFRVRLPEFGRLELELGEPVDAGYLSANGTLRPLPVGSTLRDGWFAWMPPPGYLGDYDLIFVRGNERIDVTVTVGRLVPVADGEAQVRMHLDGVTPTGATTVSGRREVRIDGWAFDPQAPFGAGIGAVHVWATRLDVGGAPPPVFIGAADLHVSRPDVARAFAGGPPASGFVLHASLAPGAYDLTAYVWNERTQRFEDARSVTVVVR